MKASIRAAVQYQLQHQEARIKSLKDRNLIAQLLQSKPYQKAHTIATYLPMAMEVDTNPLIEWALGDGKRVLVPKVLPNHQMVFLPYAVDLLKRSSYGILEPMSGSPVAKSEIDWIHVPGLAWNQNGFRIGFGGGYYDRFLVDFTGHTVSTAYDFQIKEFQPDSYDIAVKEVVTYEGTKRFYEALSRDF